MDSFPGQSSGPLADRVVSYVSEVDAHFGRRIRGADRRLIDEYALILGCDAEHPLPADFNSCLESIGIDHGGLLDPFRMRSRLDWIVEMYQEATDLEPMSAQLPVFATYIVGDQVSVERRNGEWGHVVSSSDGERGNYLAESLEHFLFKAAFLFREQQRWSCQYLSASANGAQRAAGDAPNVGLWVRAQVQAFFEGRGARVFWPSDARELLMGGDGFSLCLTTDSIGGFQLQVFQPLQRPDIELERFTFGIGVSSRQVFAAGRRNST